MVLDSGDVVQGKILWLPDLSKIKALRETRGASPRHEIKDWVYPDHEPSLDFLDRPVVLLSRPESEPDLVYFQTVSIAPLSSCLSHTKSDVLAHVFRRKNPTREALHLRRLLCEQEVFYRKVHPYRSLSRPPYEHYHHYLS